MSELAATGFRVNSGNASDWFIFVRAKIQTNGANFPGQAGKSWLGARISQETKRSGGQFANRT